MPNLKRAKQIVDRFNGSSLHQLESRNEEISRIACSRRESVHISGQVSTSHTEDHQLDTTARESAQVLVNGIVGRLIPPSNPWMAARQQDDHTDKNKIALATAMRRVFKDLSSGTSNFYDAAPEAILSGIHYGTMCMQVTPGRRRKFNFKSIPAGHYIYILDEEGYSDTILRKWSMSADAMEKFFGKDGLPAKVLQDLNSPDLTKRETRYMVIHQIEPNSNPSDKDIEVDLSKRAYKSEYVLEESSTPEIIGMTLDNGDVVEVDGLYENPYINERLFTVAGSDIGEGITSLILPKIREIQNSKEQQNRVKDQIARPSWFTPGTEEYDFNEAEQNFVYDPFRPNSKPERIQADPNAPAVIQHDLDQIKKAIEASYYTDYFRFFTNQDMAQGARTAFESAAIKAEQLSLAIVMVTRDILFFSRIVETVFDMKTRMGDFADLIDDFPASYEVEITSPLAKALEGSRKEAFVEMIGLIAQVDPIMPWLKHTHDFQSEIVDILVDSPLDTENVRTKDEATEFYEQELQLQQAAQIAQVANLAGDAASKFNQGEQ